MGQPWEDLVLWYSRDDVDQWVTVICAHVNLKVPVRDLVLVVLDPMIGRCYRCLGGCNKR